MTDRLTPEELDAIRHRVDFHLGGDDVSVCAQSADILALLHDHEAMADRAEAAERKVAAVLDICSQIEAMPIPDDPGMSQTQITSRIVGAIVRSVRRAVTDKDA